MSLDDPDSRALNLSSSAMSLHLLPPAALENQENEDSDCETSESENDDQNWDDWVSDSLIRAPCPSLFDEKSLPSVEEALNYDKETHGFDLNGLCTKLCQ